MTTERIKEIQEKTAYPDSISVQQALLQVWNECEQEKTLKQINQDNPVTRGSTALIPTFSQTELSDNEIWDAANKEFRHWEEQSKGTWMRACQWYREQLKKK